MAVYITRVELHDAKWDDYNILHREMRSEGFKQTIASDQGVSFHLPTAEYHISTALSLSQVLEKAKAAATRTRKGFGVLVTESVGRLMWDGLARV